MPTSAARHATAAAVAYTAVLSDDGTRLRAWTNDPEGRIEGPTVVLCNGLGMNPFMWPALLRPDCGVRVVSWNHRGTGGSARPADTSRVGVEEFVEDGLSVMDHFGIDRAVLLGWSTGVDTMFELAVRNPERVTGLFAVAGVPGDPFAAMLGPLHLPRLLTRGVTVNLCRGLRLAGKAISPVSSRLPVGARFVDALARTGFLSPVPDPELAAFAIGEFLSVPLDWYAHLALGTSRHARASLSGITVPTAFVAASYDVLAGARDLASAAARIPGATYHELRGSHFIAMEQPDSVHRLLLDFLGRLP